MGLKDHQVDGVRFLLEKKRCILAHEMGLGKTRMVIEACKELKSGYILVVCLQYGALKVWPDELVKWWPEAHYVVVQGTKPQRMALWESEAQIYIVGGQSLSSDIEDIELSWDVLVVDEAHHARNRKTRTFKTLKKVARKSENVYLLTGTPIVRHPDNMWTLLHLVNPKEFSSYWRFAYEHFKITQEYMAVVVGEVLDEDRLSACIEPYMLRRMKNDVGEGLPPKETIKIWVTHPPEWQEQYNKLRDELYTILVSSTGAKKRVALVNVISQVTRLKQLAISPSLVADNNDIPLDCPKTRCLLDIIEDLFPNQLVVYSQFSSVIVRTALFLMNESKAKISWITGVTSKYDREAILKMFDDNRIQALLCSTGVGGSGLTLTNAATAVFLDKLWTPAANEQAQDRIHRIGQERDVTIIEILTKGTIEEKIEEVLAGRKQTTEDILSPVESISASRATYLELLKPNTAT